MREADEAQSAREVFRGAQLWRNQIMNADYPSPILKRKLERALSVLDQAVQGLAIVMNGSISVYDHDWPIRSVEVQDSEGIHRRISVNPIWTEDSTDDPACKFQLTMDAWKDDGRHWHVQKTVLEKLPDDFAEQFAILNDCWSKVSNVALSDLAL